MILPAGLEKKQARIEDKISENIFQKRFGSKEKVCIFAAHFEVKKKSVSLQPISKERVLTEQKLIDNTGKDNEVKKQQRNEVQLLIRE